MDEPICNHCHKPIKSKKDFILRRHAFKLFVPHHKKCFEKKMKNKPYFLRHHINHSQFNWHILNYLLYFLLGLFIVVFCTLVKLGYIFLGDFSAPLIWFFLIGLFVGFYDLCCSIQLYHHKKSFR